ncbi:hypothetical protein MPSEU_001053400 [Mayamaea pseudoterrestris]|nr:hypothetical protein MPSEU_001053400 [Mayamaea pseudoterrestris]
MPSLSDQDALKDANKLDLDFIAAFSAAKEPKDGYVFGSASRGVGYYSLDEESDCLVDACRILQELLVMNIKHHAANLASMQTKKCTCFGKKLTREEKMEYDYLTGKVHEMERMVEHLRVAIQSGNAPIGTAKSEPWWTCYTALACDARELGNATNVKVEGGSKVVASGKVPMPKPILKTPSSPKANRPMTTRPPVSSPPRKKTTFSTTRSSSTNMFPYLDSGDSLVPVHCGITTHCHTSSWASSGGGGGHHSCSGGGGGNCGGGGGSSGGGGGGCGGGGGGCGGC